MEVPSTDPGSALLAIKQQISDLKDFLAELDSTNFPNDQGDDPGEMSPDLRNQLCTLETKVRSITILKEEYDSRVTIQRFLDEERQAVSDRQLAMSMAGLAVDRPDTTNNRDQEATPCSTDDSSTARADEDATGGEDEAENTYVEEEETKPSSTCSVCLELVQDENILTLACDHTYCRSCLHGHIKSALADMSLFPPRCCKALIPVETCHTVLPKELVKEFDLKVEEGTHPNPTFCNNSDCAQFIRVQDIKDEVGTCVFCGSKTCVVCKAEQHEGLCPKDPNVTLLMDIAERNKWQQCSHCKNMVELERGCFHMT